MQNNQQAPAQEQIDQYVNQVVGSVHQAYRGIVGDLAQKLAIQTVQTSELKFVAEMKDKEIANLQEQMQHLQHQIDSTQEVTHDMQDVGVSQGN